METRRRHVQKDLRRERKEIGRKLREANDINMFYSFLLKTHSDLFQFFLAFYSYTHKPIWSESHLNLSLSLSLSVTPRYTTVLDIAEGIEREEKYVKVCGAFGHGGQNSRKISFPLSPYGAHVLPPSRRPWSSKPTPWFSQQGGHYCLDDEL